MPAPPARIRSAKVPCGFSSNCNSPLVTSCSKSLFSPTYVETIFFTWRFCRSRPMPKLSIPALLLTMVKSFTPLRRTAAMRFSGMPQRPKPPIRMVAPSWRFSMAASDEEMRLSTKDSQVREKVYSKWLRANICLPPFLLYRMVDNSPHWSVAFRCEDYIQRGERQHAKNFNKEKLQEGIV